MELKPMNIVGGITAALALIGAIISFDARYTKVDDLVKVKIEIIHEMRQEVVKNRTVMINAMQREADDLEYQMAELEKASQPVPRYMSDKFKHIQRQIEALKNDKNDTE
jgi:hypothetical protein